MAQIDWNYEIGGGCPTQGWGSVEVEGKDYAVYFRSRHGSWSLEITDPTTKGLVWEWHGTDNTAWGLMDPSASELCDLLVSKPVAEWPTPSSYAGGVTIEIPVVLKSGIHDAAHQKWDEEGE